MGRQELDTTEQLSFPSSLLLVQPLRLALMFGPRQKRRRDHLITGRLLLFRQGGAMVSLTNDQAESARDRGGFTFRGRFVEAISEMLVRRDVLGNL